VTLLFNQRPELVPIARNPFTAALISSYAKDHGGALPENQSELYSSYIERRLDACSEKLEMKNLTKEKVIGGAIEIADIMLSTQTMGLESSIAELKSRMPSQPLENIINILQYARLGRLGTGAQQRFSFVHRRFNEYFVVQRLMKQPDRIPKDAIPTDSRWRDALVLYCEVADENQARGIAEFCWSEVAKLDEENLDLSNPQTLRSIHCLRFLKDAFRARLYCIDSFRNELAALVANHINRKAGLLFVKLAVEAVGLLEKKDMDIALVKALEINNEWINETALKSCHYLPELSKELKERLRNAIYSINILDFIKRRRELIFSLKLSNVFADLKRFCYWRTVDCYCLLIGLVLLTLSAPATGLMVVFTLLFFYWLLPIGISSRQPRPWFEGRFRLYMAGMLFFFLIGDSVGDVARNAISQLLAIPGGHALKGFSSEIRDPRLFIAATLFITPWHNLYYFVLPTILRLAGQYHLSTIAYKLGKFIIVSIISAGGLFLVVWFFLSLPETVAKILLFSFSILGPGFLVFLFFYFFVAWWRDLRHLKKLQKTVAYSRQEISEHFGRFRTNKGRLDYVRSLQNAGVIPSGTWPSGKIPNFLNDEASTLLAKLEEKWLGLAK
jgi:hypothetical protein